MKENRQAYLNDKQAARYIGFKAQTLRNWRHARKGPKYIKQSRSVRYSVRDLDEWMEGRKISPCEAEASEIRE